MVKNAKVVMKSVSREFDTAMKTVSSRRFKQYPITELLDRVGSKQMFTEVFGEHWQLDY